MGGFSRMVNAIQWSDRVLSGWLCLSIRAPWPNQVEGVPTEADSYITSALLKVHFQLLTSYNRAGEAVWLS